MRQWIKSVLAAAMVALIGLSPAMAGGLCEKSCSGCKDPCKTPACEGHNIPGTKKVCTGLPEVEKVKGTEFDVECKDICIPRVRFPWEKDCCQPRCGRVRTVKVLKTVETEKEECAYKWDIHTILAPCKVKKCHKDKCETCAPACDSCAPACESEVLFEVIDAPAGQ